MVDNIVELVYELVEIDQVEDEVEYDHEVLREELELLDMMDEVHSEQQTIEDDDEEEYIEQHILDELPLNEDEVEYTIDRHLQQEPIEDDEVVDELVFIQQVLLLNDEVV